MEDLFESVRSMFVAYGPKILAAIAILAIGFLLAKLMSGLVASAIDNSRFGRSANEQSDTSNPSVGASIASAVFWVLMLITLTLALGALELNYILAPLNNMLNEVLTFLPNILGAGLIFLIGAIVAKVAQRAVTSVLAAAQFDTAAQRLGFGAVTGAGGPTKAVGLLVYALILIPIAVAGLNALRMESVSGPATAMLESVLAAIPRVFAAGLVLLITVVIARAVSNLLRTLLPQFGLDSSLTRLGLMSPGADRGLTPSVAAANIAAFAVVLFGAIEASKLLDFEILSRVLTEVLTVGGSILFGGVIIFAGVWVSGLVARAIAATGSGATDVAAQAMRILVIGLSVILGVSRMGLDPSGQFVTSAALILLAAAGVAAAIAFGLGGREWAARILAKLDDKS